MYNIFELNEKSLDDLKIIATEMGHAATALPPMTLK